MQRLSPNARGSLYMAIGSVGYVVNDGLVRKTTEQGPGVYQVLCIRTMGMIVLFGVVAQLRGERTRRSHLTRPLLTRVAAEVVAGALFFAAIVQIEFANAQAILQLIPFAVTLAAAIFLKEHVTGVQYLVVLVGFIGVLFVVRPGTDAFSPWALLAALSALVLVVRELATRDVTMDIPATSIAFVTAIGFSALTGVISAFDGWQPLNLESALLIAASGCWLFIGYLFTIQTVRIGDLSVSAPFRYTTLLGAVVVGYLLFDEVPDAPTIIGTVIIVVSGIYAVRLERRRTTRPGAVSTTPG